MWDHIEEDMDTKLIWFQQFVMHLKYPFLIFMRPDLLEVFREECLRGSPFEFTTHLFEHVCPRHIQWRWGSIFAVATWLINRMDAIRGSWNSVKIAKRASIKQGKTDGFYVNEGDAQDKRGNRVKLDLQRCTKIVHDVFFGILEAHIHLTFRG